MAADPHEFKAPGQPRRPLRAAAATEMRRVYATMSRMWLYALAAAGAIFGVLGYLRARRVARRLEQLAQSYWELRYQHGQLRAQVNRLDPDRQPEPEPGMPARPTENFIPLSSLKR